MRVECDYLKDGMQTIGIKYSKHWYVENGLLNILNLFLSLPDSNKK